MTTADRARDTVAEAGDRGRLYAVRAQNAAIAVLAAAEALASACTGTGRGQAQDCTPAPGSCDSPPPGMNPFDIAHGCLAAPVALAGVCNTSVNRCDPSAGIGPVCAFAPDGGVFVAILSDNQMLTGAGWRFSQPVMSFPNAAAIPLDEMASDVQGQQCEQAQCASPCPGVEPLAYRFFCRDDAGDARP